MTKSRYDTFLLYKYTPIILAVFILSFIQKGEVVLWVQSFHNSFLDLFFSGVTVLGDATWTVLILIWIIYKSNYRWLSLLILAFLLHGFFVHIFKQWLASGAPRPFSYFTERSQADLLHLIENIKIRKWNSFPSGHTATAFFMASFIIGYNNFSSASKWVCYSLALLVGISRMYLGQHFYIDIVFGAFFGMLAFDLAHITLGSAKKTIWNQKIIKSKTK